MGVIFLFQTDSGRAEAIIRGAASRPFPLLMNLDYNRCRAEAWLAALEHAAKLLPANALQTIGDLGTMLPYARLALCALAFPVDVATPELSAGAVIQVYLEDRAENITASQEPARLVMMGLLIAETRKLIQETAAAWPTRIAPETLNLQLLEDLSQKLGTLWILTGKADLPELEKAAREFPDSLAIALACAEKCLKSGRLSAKDEFIEYFQAALAKNEAWLSQEMRGLLASYLLYLKGRWNLRANQFAIAERQFGELAEQSLFMRIFSRQAIEALLEHATFMRRKGKLPEMCADLLSICALGDCHPLMESRLRGFCVSGEK